MISVTQWAIRHGVSAQALLELERLFGQHGGHFTPDRFKGDNEAIVQSLVRLEAANKNVRLFRNNVGVLTDATGRPVRYGLANDSAQVNKVIKSSDLIGWRPVKITQHHVGNVIAQFVARECKRKDWQWSGDERERAQMAFIQLVTAAGGDAAFCTGEGTL